MTNLLGNYLKPGLLTASILVGGCADAASSTAGRLDASTVDVGRDVAQDRFIPIDIPVRDVSPDTIPLERCPASIYGVRRVSVGTNGVQSNDDSSVPYVDRTGRRIVFGSDATNIAGSPDTNQASDVFLHNTTTCTTTRISVTLQGNEASFYDRLNGVWAAAGFQPYINDNYVTFTSRTPTLFSATFSNNDLPRRNAKLS